MNGVLKTVKQYHCTNTMDYVTKYRILVTAYDVLPQLEFFITNPVEVKINKTKHRITKFSSYSYQFTKLPIPYVDDCMDYKQLGHRNRFDTISSCVNNKTIRTDNPHDRAYSRTKIITRDMVDLYNMKIQKGSASRPSKKCYQSYQKDDCSFELTYTDHETVDSFGSSEYAV